MQDPYAAQALQFWVMIHFLFWISDIFSERMLKKMAAKIFTQVKQQAQTNILLFRDLNWIFPLKTFWEWEMRLPHKHLLNM